MIKFPIGIEAEAVVFDFDGVIVDTEPLHYNAFQQVLTPLNLGFSWQEYIDIFMGFDDRDAFIEIFNKSCKQLTLDDLTALISLKADTFQKIITNGVVPYPGVIKLITELHKSEVPLAISSGALHSDINPILKMLGLDSCFNIIVSAEDVVKSKPDPACYKLAYSILHDQWPKTSITPATTLAIEDTPAGISSALQAGLQVVAVTNSYSRDHINNATTIVSSLSELTGFKKIL